MHDNDLLETLVVAILMSKGMENTEHSVVRFARRTLNEIRKAQFNLAGEKFAVPAGKDENSVYEY
jgi:hypothetical protein